MEDDRSSQPIDCDIESQTTSRSKKKKAGTSRKEENEKLFKKMLAELKEEYSDVLTPQMDLTSLYIPRPPQWMEKEYTNFEELFENMYPPSAFQKRDEVLKNITGWNV